MRDNDKRRDEQFLIEAVNSMEQMYGDFMGVGFDSSAESIMHNITRMFSIFAELEPKDLRKYFYIDKDGRPLVPGTTVTLLISQPYATTEGGLLVPKNALGKQPIDFMGTYITIDDYWPLIELDNNSWKAIVKFISSGGSFIELITNLALLNYMVGDENKLDDIAKQFTRFLSQFVSTDIANRLNYTLRYPRVFLSRQGILAAMREVFSRRSEVKRTGVISNLLSSIILVHAISSSLYKKTQYGNLPLGGAPPDIAMDLIRSEIFYYQQHPLLLLSRNYLLWTKYGNKLTRATTRKTPTEMLKDATGLDILDWISLGLAVWTFGNSDTGKLGWFNRSFFPSISPDILDRFLGCISRNSFAFQEMFQECKGAWDFSPLEKYPLLESDDHYLVLDNTYFIERLTDGLYWYVHDNEKSISDRYRLEWTQAYGEMLETYVVDLVKQMSLCDLSGHSMVYSEIKFQEAFNGKISDVGIDFGQDFCIIEVVSGRVTNDTRIEGVVGQFERDTTKLVIKKAIQLHELSQSIINNELKLTGRPKVPGRRIFPVIVNLGTYPVNPLSQNNIEEILEEKDLFQDPRVMPLSIIGVGELEIIHAIFKIEGQIMPEILQAWKQSSLSKMPLYYFLFSKSKLSGITWYSLVPIAEADIIERAIKRLRLDDEQ